MLINFITFCSILLQKFLNKYVKYEFTNIKQLLLQQLFISNIKLLKKTKTKMKFKKD